MTDAQEARKLRRAMAQQRQSFEVVRRHYDREAIRLEAIEQAAREYLRETDKLALTMAAVDAKVELLRALAEASDD